MKVIIRIQLLPAADQAAELKAVTERYNAAADWLAGELFACEVSNKREAQRLFYREIRDWFGLSSQAATLCIHRACEAYKRDKTVRPRFRKDAAITYDARTMSFKGIDRVSLLVLTGRIVVPMIVPASEADWIDYPMGQCDLVLRKDGKWFLMVTVDVPEDPPIDSDDLIGVDLGVAGTRRVIATDSDGDAHTGADVDKVRRKYNLQLQGLRHTNTKGSKKKAQRFRRKEARFRRHQNHVISKQIVETAKRIGRGIALEDLGGISGRVTARGGEARTRLSGWAFAQLSAFVVHKAGLAGVPVEYVDPRNTSRTCAECQHCERSNRESQSEFRCKACGYKSDADVNAARNIRVRALSQACHRTGKPTGTTRGFTGNPLALFSNDPPEG